MEVALLRIAAVATGGRIYVSDPEPAYAEATFRECHVWCVVLLHLPDAGIADSGVSSTPA